jgi:lipopolysaccharide export system permease protein
MDRVQKLVFKNYIESFNTIFFTLLFLASIIFFIGIAKITAIIKISFLELGQIYLFLLPEIILYTLPISLFVGMVISLFKMSKENELVVIFACGYNPKKITKVFMYISILSSLMLLITSLYLVPNTKRLFKNYITYKKSEAKINIKATEFGQKYNDWYLFINQQDKENKLYEDIVMLNVSEQKEAQNFMIAKSAKVSNTDGLIQLYLDKGSVFNIENDSIIEIVFDSLTLNSRLISGSYLHVGAIEYWFEALKSKKTLFKLSFYTLMSLFIVVIFPISMMIGIVNSRYDKPHIYIFMFLTTIVYFGISFAISSLFPYYSTLIFAAITSYISFKLYKREILSKY